MISSVSEKKRKSFICTFQICSAIHNMQMSLVEISPWSKKLDYPYIIKLTINDLNIFQYLKKNKGNIENQWSPQTDYSVHSIESQDTRII